MREPRLIETRDVALEEITVPKRLRPASKSAVAAVRDSIKEMTVALTPIALRSVDGSLVLIAGLHRLEAYRELGRAAIRAEIWNCSANWSRLAEIDENLAGGDLSTLEQATFLAARKRLYQQLHPETKRGGDRRSAGYSKGHASPFGSVIAEKRGISVRQVNRLTQFGESIDPRAAAILLEHTAPPSFRDLRRLCELPAHEQARAAKMLGDGEAASLKAAIAAVEPERAPVEQMPAEERAYRDLRERFDRAPMTAKRRFVEQLWGQYRDLVLAGAPAEALDRVNEVVTRHEGHRIGGGDES